MLGLLGFPGCCEACFGDSGITACGDRRDNLLLGGDSCGGVRQGGERCWGGDCRCVLLRVAVGDSCGEVEPPRRQVCG